MLMIFLRAENMFSTLQMIKVKYGGAEGYAVDKCGLTLDEVGRIRKNLVDEKTPVHAKQNL